MMTTFTSINDRWADSEELSVEMLDDEPEVDDALVAADQPHTGVMIALVPSAEDATRLTLLDEEGALPAAELHLTLAYLGEAEQLPPATVEDLRGLVEQLATTIPPIEAEVFGVALVSPTGEEPCIVLLVGHAEVLPELYLDLTNQLHASQIDTSMDHRPWLPHLTLAYTDDHYLAADLVDRTGPVKFDRLRLAVAGEVLDFPLTGGSPPAAVEGP